MKYKLTESDLNKFNYITRLDLQYIIEDMDDISELEEALEEAINEYEVIYHATAIEILSEEDPSLRSSLDIASEYGLTLENLNSETLATILIQDSMREEVQELVDIVEDIYN